MSLYRDASWAAGPDGRHRGEITASWCQGRTAFGGLPVTAALRAMRAAVDPDRRLRSFLVSFVGPVARGPAAVELTVLRQGGSMTQVRGDVVQEGRVATTVMAAFGTTRPTRLRVDPPPPPRAEPPDGLPELPYVEGVTPAFTRHFDYRWLGDGLPFSGAPEARVRGYVRPRDGRETDEAAVAALIDAWPPPVWARAGRPFPASSVTWMVNLTGVDPRESPAGAWWLYDSETTQADGGYDDYGGSLWDADGRLVATTRQLVAEFSG